MKTEELKQKYPNEWILVRVLEEDALQQPTQVEIIAHSVNRDDIYDALLQVPPQTHVATLFTGPLLKEGYAAAFFCLWK